MRLFVTGASGWIGSAVVAELLGAGHEAVGLARSDASAVSLLEAGATVVRGDLDDLDVLANAAGESDGVIHLAFKHDLAFSGNFEAAADADRAAVATMLDALAGSNAPFVLASGLLGMKPGEVAVESDHADAALLGDAAGPQTRLATAELVANFATNGVRTSVVRLPPTNHGVGDNGFLASIIGFAREKGASAYLNNGANRWPAVHRLDSAKLFRLAAESAPAGSTLHAVADEGVPLVEVATVIARHLELPLVSLTPEEAPAHFSWMTRFIGLDAPASSRYTKELLGWEPSHVGLLADLDEGHYFSTLVRPFNH
ncbi:MAG TPA: SDR family oxidoreductase [Acidimicrobiales bacterium]